MSLSGPGGIAQHHVCQMIDIVRCFEIKFLKRRQKVLFCSAPREGYVISGRQRNLFSENRNAGLRGKSVLVSKELHDGGGGF